MTPDACGRAVRGRSQHRPRPWLEIALFGTGGGLLAVLLSRVGTTSIVEAFARVGPGLWLIVGVEFLAILANTLSWRSAIAGRWRGKAPFGRLIAARIVGDALNYVAPAGAGEIAKVRLLSRFIATEPALASVVLARLTEGMALGVFGFLGLLAGWSIMARNPASTVPIAIATLAGATMVVGSVVAVRFGLVTALVGLVQRLRWGRLVVSGLAGVTRDEGAAASVAEGRTGSATASTAWHLGGWLVNVTELWLACHFLGLLLPLTAVFAGEALGALCDGVFFLVPLKIGVAEGGRVFVFALLGLSPAQGLTLGLIRRARELTWTTIGLAICPWLGSRAALGERGGGRPEAATVNT